MTTWSRLIYQHDPLAIAQGDVNYYSSIHKFGANFNIDTQSTPESIWTAGGLYPWSSLSTAQTLYVISTSSNDTDTVSLEGLDSNYQPLSEVVQVSGTNAVTTSNQFLRIFRMEYNHGGTNDGVITARVTNGTGTVVAQIDASLAQSLMAIYTVPTGFTAYMTNLDCSTSKGDDIQFQLYAREVSTAFRIKHISEVYQSNYRYDFHVPLKFLEKTDIDMIAAEVANANTKVTANFDLILVDNARPNH